MHASITRQLHPASATLPPRSRLLKLISSGPSGSRIAASSRLQQLSPAAPEDDQPDCFEPALLPEQDASAGVLAAGALVETAAQLLDASDQTYATAACGSEHGWTVSDDPAILAAAEQLSAAERLVHSRRQPGSSRSSSGGLTAQLADEQQQEEEPQQQQQQEQQQEKEQPQQQQQQQQPASSSLSTSHSCAVVPAAGAAAAAEPSAGGFFASRAPLLRQLREQQLLQQRQHLLAKRRKALYQYTLSADGSRIVTAERPGPKSPLRQDVFPLAKRPPAGWQQQQPGTGISISSSSSSGSTSLDRQGGDTEPQQQQQRQQPQPQPQWQSGLAPQLELRPPSSSSRGGSSTAPRSQQPEAAGLLLPASSSALSPAAGDADAGADADPSRGLSLAAFLYCCSRKGLLRLTWQLGLPPESLRFVSRVAEADLVLHVKPRPGERHYQYDELRAQAAAKGIPFVDLKALSRAELQLYLLPVFRLYAREVSPRALLLRKKRRCWANKRRYTAIKLPPA